MGNFVATSFIFSILYLGLIGLGVYCLILFIQLAQRGIRALDIYIKEKEEHHSS